MTTAMIFGTQRVPTRPAKDQWSVRWPQNATGTSSNATRGGFVERASLSMCMNRERLKPRAIDPTTDVDDQTRPAEDLWDARR